MWSRPPLTAVSRVDSNLKPTELETRLGAEFKITYESWSLNPINTVQVNDGRNKPSILKLLLETSARFNLRFNARNSSKDAGVGLAPSGCPSSACQG